MKKFISVLLCILMLVPFAVPFASAADAVGKIVLTIDTDIDGEMVDNYSDYVTIESENVVFEDSNGPAVEAYNTTTEGYDYEFEGGNYYIFTIRLTEAPYYALPSAGTFAEVEVNGGKYAVLVQEKNTGFETISYIKLEIELYVGDPMKCLKAIDFRVPTPVAGATPADVSQVYADNMGVNIVAIEWFPDDPVFVEGTEYTFQLSLETAEGFIFDKNIYLSHDMGDAYKIGSGKNELKMSYTFPATPPAPGPIVITEINATVAEPVVGEAPSDVVTTTGTGYTVALYMWYHTKDLSGNIPEFEGGNTYIVQVIFTPEDGYAFADNVKATINGKDADLRLSNLITGFKVFDIEFDELPIPEYNISVINGTASASKTVEGATVTLTANPAPTGKVFDKWVVTGATVDNATSETATLTMPANDVTAQATYKDAVYKITVINGTASATTAMKGDKITVKAAQIDGKVFDHWQIDGSFCDNIYYKETDFEVKTSDITAEAVYEDCDCKCHTGNFFFKIVLFFQKLFGQNKVCACGMKH